MYKCPSALDPQFRNMYSGGRRSGRTSKLICSSPLNCVIVCATTHQARYVQWLAVERGRADLKCISASVNAVYRAHDDIMRFTRGTNRIVTFDHFWVERFFEAGNDVTALQWLEKSINARFYLRQQILGAPRNCQHDNKLTKLVEMLTRKTQ